MATQPSPMEAVVWDIDGFPTARISDELPTKEAEAAVNKLYTAPAKNFDLRGRGYLTDKKKCTAEAPMFQFVDLRPFLYKTGIKHVCKRLRPVKDLIEKHPDREFFVVNRMLPTEPALTVVTVFVRQFDHSFDPAFETGFKRYKEDDDSKKDLKLKYICKIPNAPFLLRGAVSAFGGFRPVIMGKGYLQQYHFSGTNYTEVDIDVGSSRIARGIMGVVVPQMKKLIVDEAFLIEGQASDELPERLVGLSRGVRYDFKGNNEIPVQGEMLLPDEDADDGDSTTATK